MARRVRPRGHIEERPNGSFRAIVYAGIDPLTRKARYLKKTAPTETQALVELTKLQNQVDEQRHPRSGITVRQVIDKWLEVTELEDKTRERYGGLLRNHIGPAFGDLPAAKLDAESLERYYARLRKCRHLCTRASSDHECKPLSASSVRAIHFMFRAALDRAVRWRYLGVNEAAMAVPPAFQRSDPDPPSAAEVAALLNEPSKDPWWVLLLWLVMVSGCRRGEMCALRWTDVDLTKGILSIERSYSQTVARRREKRTKAGQRRRIAIDVYTVSLLEIWHAQCQEQCQALGLELANDAFVFSLAPDFSTPLIPNSVTQRYRRLATRCKLRSTRIHSLRHYSATELLTAGVDLRTVSGRLGHGSGGATTLRFYAAWVDEADKRAADTIANIVPRPGLSRPAATQAYELLALELRRAIANNEFPVGSLLPTTTELSKKHGVARGTVNRAVSILKADGLVNAGKGRGCRVLSIAPDQHPKAQQAYS